MTGTASRSSVPNRLSKGTYATIFWVSASARTSNNSSLFVSKFVTQIASNGNFQIKVHCFTSQHLPQR